VRPCADRYGRNGRYDFGHLWFFTPGEQQHEATPLGETFNKLIDWSSFLIMGNTVPPRDPDEDEEDEDNSDEPQVVREPDED
jgi:hypothetical protein